MTDRHTLIPAVWVIVTDPSGKIFMLRRANTGWRDGSWTVPAGHVEKGEGPSAAAVRELAEEAGIVATVNELSDPLVYFYPQDDGAYERVSIFFRFVDKAAEAHNAEPSKADAADWFMPDALPTYVPPLLRRAFIDMAQGVGYSERYYDIAYHKELLQ